MAEDNTKLIETMNDTMWFSGSPVFLCSMRLALDTATGDMFTSAKFQNLQPDSLRSIIFDVICYDGLRQAINVIENVTFGGLDVSRNAMFGFHRRIRIPDIQTRNTEFVLRSVSFSNGRTWTNNEYKRFDTKIEQKNIFSVQGDYNKQFLDLCARSGINGTDLVLQPEFYDDHWLCACGAFNWGSEEKCSQCRIGRSWLVRNTDIESLKKRRESQDANVREVQELVKALEEETNDRSAERAEFEAMGEQIKAGQKKERTQRIRHRMLITLAVLIVIAGLVYILMTFLFPKFLEAEEYENGTDLINASAPAQTGISDGRLYADSYTESNNFSEMNNNEAYKISAQHYYSHT